MLISASPMYPISLALTKGFHIGVFSAWRLRLMVRATNASQQPGLG